MRHWGMLKRYTSSLAVLDTLLNSRIVLTDPRAWPDRNDREGIALYAATEARPVWAYCMAEGRETAHHWQVFADRGWGACISFSKARLIEAVSSNSAIRHGAIDYVNWRDLILSEPHSRLPFIKRQVFRAEREYRLIAVGGRQEQTGYSVGIPLDCITSVVVSGELPAAHFETMERIIRSTKGCERIAIRQSGLLQNRRWSEVLGGALVGVAGNATV